MIWGSQKFAQYYQARKGMARKEEQTYQKSDESEKCAA